MRLIDADALLEQIEVDSIGKEVQYGDEWLFLETIENAPTIDRPSSEWIPCSDRLPEEDGHYIVYAPSYRGGSSGGKEMHNGVMFSRFKNGKWSIEVGYHKRPGCVKAWMPLPAIWEEGESNG